MTRAVPRPRRAPARALARMPHLVEREVTIAGLDERHDGLRVAHITDVHCGRITPPEHIRAAVALANRARPDLIAMTGDYVCWKRDEVPLVADLLSGLSAAPVLCTLGNHDYFAAPGGDDVAAALEQSGYIVLRNQHRTLELRGAPVHVIGVDDPVTRKDDIGAAHDGVPEGGTRLILCHCPEKAGELAERGAHLVLAGHTHGGQVNVKGITDRIFKRAGRRYYQTGLYEVGGTWLYVSAGVGFSGVRVRAGRGTRAEVAVLTLRSSRA